MYGKLRDKLIANGYKPIPLNGKIPLTSNWLNADPPDGHESANVGIVLRGLVAIDIDIDDPAAVDITHRRMPVDAPMRTGRLPREMFLFRTNDHITKRALRLVDAEGNPQAIEILGEGQQFAAFGTHPGTGTAFNWLGQSPETTAADWLPTITSAEIDDFLIESERRLLEYGFSRPESSGSGSMLRLSRAMYFNFGMGSDVPREVQQALTRLDADDYSSWIAVGHALKASGEDWAFSAFDEWSSTSDKYPGAEAIRARWDGFSPDKSPGLSAIARASGVALNKPEDYFQSTNALPDPETAVVPFIPILFEITDNLATHPVWAVEGFLEEAAIGVLWGPPTSKKTFLALDWALHIAHGEPWLEQRCPQGPVWIIAGEGFSGIHRRIYGANKFRGRPLASVGAGLLVSKASIHLSREENRKRLSAHFNAGPRPRLIVIDTLSRNLGEGADENKAADVAAYLEVVAALAREMHVTVLIVHHSRKDGSDFRGTSAIKGNVDFEFEMKPSGAALTLKCWKMKDAAPPPDRMLCTRIVHISDMPNQWGEVRPVTTLAVDGVTAADLAEIQEAREDADDAKNETRDDGIIGAIQVVRLARGPSGKVSRNSVYENCGGQKTLFLDRVTAMIVSGRIIEDAHLGLCEGVEQVVPGSGSP